MEQTPCKNKSCCMHEIIDEQTSKDTIVNIDDLHELLKSKSFEEVTKNFLDVISKKNDGIIKEIQKIQDKVIKIENMKRDFENVMETFANKYHEETRLLYKKLNDVSGDDTIHTTDEEEDCNDFKTSAMIPKRRFK